MTDFAEQFRKDIKVWGVEVVVPTARKHLNSLKALPEGTDDRDAAIRDVTKFLEDQG